MERVGALVGAERPNLGVGREPRILVYGEPFGHSLEQVTYLEWLNSTYQTDFKPGPNAKSCQDCHMASSYVNAANKVDVPLIQTAFADVQDAERSNRDAP